VSNNGNERVKTSLSEAANYARGWVYVISNKAMPGFSKIGYTMKDPDLRAVELGHTGSPFPYQVEFDVLVTAPKVLEQSIHKALKEFRAGREWFEISPEKVAESILDFLALHEKPTSHEVFCVRDNTAIYVKAAANNSDRPTGSGASITSDACVSQIKQTIPKRPHNDRRKRDFGL